MTLGFPPGLILIAAAVLLPFLRGRAHDGAAVLAAVAALVATCVGVFGEIGTLTVAFAPGIELTLLQANAPTRVFATIFAIAAVAGTLFAIGYGRRAELAGAHLYAGAALCAVFAGDLLTVFCWWELMAIGSTVVVWTGGQRDSGPAGWRYAGLHFVGGALLLAGIAAWSAAGGSLLLPTDPLASPLVEQLTRLDSVAAWLILLGLLINAGMPPLGAWLADAYPEASPSGAVFLSAFTTKTAVFVLIMCFAGAEVLVWVGLIMAIQGLAYSLLESDLRRILAYGIICQVGLMLCAIGVGTPLALAGASAHAVAHILYKGLLFMSTGAVLQATGVRSVHETAGLHRRMPFTIIIAIFAALAMAGLPLTAGFASKPLITSAVAHAGDRFGMAFGQSFTSDFAIVVMLTVVLVLAAGKFPWFSWFARHAPVQASDPPWTQRLAMLFLVAATLVVGCWPSLLFELLPYPPVIDGGAYPVWTLGHVGKQLALIVAAGIAFLIMLPLLRRTTTVTLDGDIVYRHFLPLVWRHFALPVLRVVGRGHAWAISRLPAIIAHWVMVWRVRRHFDREVSFGETQTRIRFDVDVDHGRQWAVGGVLVVITGVLGLYLILLLT